MTMQQPTEQENTERSKDEMKRGEDDAVRGKQRRQRYFFWIINIVFRGGVM